MKGMMDDNTTESARRGLFRRARRADADASERHDSDLLTQDDSVATVDALARRMEALTAAANAGTSVADAPERAQIDMQRAVIARANDLAAAHGGAVTSGASPVMTPTVATPVPTAPEAPVQQTEIAPTTSDTTPADELDLQARMDAAMQPVSMPAPEPVQAPAAELKPTAPVTPAPTPESVPEPEFTPQTGAAAAIGIDINRVVALIEDEAAGIQRRIDMEMSDARARGEEIIDQAEAEAERIREHGQAQARVLLSEVEEIISEAQQTGEQILHRANEEASSLRGDATAVLQQAQTEARSIVETARREGEQVLSEQRRLATVRAQEAMREQDRLKDQIRRLEERRRQVLESLEPLISQLTQMMPAGLEQNVVPLQRSTNTPQS